VLGVGWMTRLPKAGVALGVGVLCAVAVANTLGDTLGVGRPVFAQVGAEHPESQLRTGRVTLYSADGYQGVSAPRRQPDLLPVLRGLRATGVRRIVVTQVPGYTDLSAAGLNSLLQIARLEYISPLRPDRATSSDAYLVHAALGQGPLGRAACVRLYDGTGILFVRGNPFVRSPRFACPRGAQRAG
jgi:hypothetical protein